MRGKGGGRSVGERLYGLLVRLYPRSFREAHGEELVAFFRLRAGESRYGGWRGRLRLLAHVMTDAASSLMKEHRDARRERLASRRLWPVERKASMSSWVKQDVRIALRQFVRAPGFALASVLTLALGIGATATMFSVIDGVLLRPLSYPESSRLVQIGSLFSGTRVRSVSPVDLTELSGARTLESVAVSRLQWLDGTGDGEPERFDAAGVSASFFDVLGVRPMLGRTFDSSADRRGGEAAVVLSHGLWQRRFGGDLSVLGRSLVLNGEPYAITGVMPAGFRGPEAIFQGDVQLWFPLGRITDPLDNRGDVFMQMIGRLRPGVTAEAATTELIAIGDRIAAEHADMGERRFWAESLHERTVGESGRLLWVLFGAVGVLLLIACANVANLFLVRATERAKEMAVRSALGGGRMRIAVQLLAETMLIALAGGLAGVALALAGVNAFQRLAPSGLPRLADIAVDVRVLGFALVLTLLIGLVFGLSPIADAVRTNLTGVLREAGGGTSGRNRMRLRSALVMVQTALALVLLTGAGLLANSLLRLTRVDPGFDARNVVWLDIDLPARRYPSAESRNLFFQRTRERLASLPGVGSVGAIHGRPLDRNRSLAMVLPEGRTIAEGEPAPQTSHHSVMPGYFGVLGIALLEGRDVSPADNAQAAPVAVVSRTFAERFWPGERALGKRFRMGDIAEGAPWVNVVGVVDDVLQYGLAEAAEPMVYRPFEQFPRGWLGFVVRADGRPAADLLAAMRLAVWDLDPALPLDDFGTMEQQVSVSIAEPRFRAMALSAFSLIAGVLAFVGLYATLAWVARTRRREMGIRLALGARSWAVRAMIVGHGMRLVGAGILVGLAGGLALSRYLAAMVYGITPTDATTFGSVTILLAMAGLLAGVVAGGKAATADPAATLRAE